MAKSHLDLKFTAIHLARGGHESNSMNKIYGFEGEVKSKLNDTFVELFVEVFCCLPLANVLNGKVFVVHGGLFSVDGVKLSDIRKINRLCEPSEEVFDYMENKTKRLYRDAAVQQIRRCEERWLLVLYPFLSSFVNLYVQASPSNPIQTSSEHPLHPLRPGFNPSIKEARNPKLGRIGE
ncbi:hypothetical protein POM88_029467 [Heracleum sosnowskyi]|uniref:Calcineurin-like phosphoesterase domain-containing protein n=1 Tax=Heracleum sosnowskyi TaxID=360622 RepID=A0AAD8HUY9_9APIA|nr:hypothetical protein POM88_029467 [Heracleum sosnowskyi]